MNGGIFVSTNSGQAFQLIGLEGATIGGIAVNGASTRVYERLRIGNLHLSHPVTATSGYLLAPFRTLRTVEKIPYAIMTAKKP